MLYKNFKFIELENFVYLLMRHCNMKSHINRYITLVILNKKNISLAFCI